MTFSFSKLAGAVAHFFEGFLQNIIGSAEGKAVETGIQAFVKTDVGALTIDAIQYASTLPAGKGAVELRDAAKAKLVADAKTAGKDLGALGEGLLNLFIEMGFTYLTGTLSNLATKQLSV